LVVDTNAEAASPETTSTLSSEVAEEESQTSTLSPEVAEEESQQQPGFFGRLLRRGGNF
jgi:hypothetical protein